jgi:ADP-ribose pyrophosphatase YjhB (NUDIX family)
VGRTLPEVPCVGGLVHDAAGRLLLIRRGHAPSAGLWSVPGGRVEPGETEEQAVVRELAEETGLAVRPERVVGRVRVDGDGVVFTVTDWACTLLDAAQRPVAGDDASDVAFVDAAGLAALATAPGVAPGVIAALSGWGVLPR